MRPNKDLRSFLKAAKEAGPEFYVEAKRPLRPELEVSALQEKLAAEGRFPVIYCPRIKGSKLPLVTDLFGSYELLGLALGLDPRKDSQSEIFQEYRRRIAKPKPVREVTASQALVAVLFFLAIYVQVDMQAAKMGLKGIPREQLPSIKTTLKEGWEFLLPLVVLVIVLFVIRYDPIISAMYTLGAVIVVSMFRKGNRLTPKKFMDSIEGGLRSTLTIGAIIALAAVVLQALVGTGLGPKLSSGLVSIFGGSMVSLVIAAGFACYIMGMGVSLTASYILVAIVVAPALREMGLPLFVAHFFILYLTTSTMFTPPYAPNSYVAGAIAGADPFKVGFKAMQLGIVCYLVPFIIVLNPALLLIGNTGDIILATVTAIVGVIALSAAIEGHLLSGLNAPQRILFAIGGMLTVIPGLVTDLPGLGILGLTLFWHWVNTRRLRASEPALEKTG
ncbi:MAG: TRAP transporter large permease subunit [Chloroflexota bacterium]